MEMIITTIVSRKALPDIGAAASTDDLRPELNYVLYEEGHFVATDGYILIRYPFEFEPGTQLPERFAIHRRHFRGLCRKSPAKTPVTIQFDGKYLNRSVKGELLHIAPIVTDVKYLAYKNVLDKHTKEDTVPVSQIGWNPDLLSRAMKLVKALVGSQHVKMVFTAPNRAVNIEHMYESCAFQMIIMPVLIGE